MTKTISQARSHNYFLQVRGSVVFKGLAVACSFFAIPLMVHYLGQARFGIWSTLLSVMSWVTFFDLGLGTGLRNKLAEALAKDQKEEARSYVSSAYSLIGIISLSLFVALAIAAFSAPWQRIFNTQLLSAGKLGCAVLITAFFIALNFWLSLINSVLNALQKTSVVVFSQFLCSILSLALVYALYKTTGASLLFLATAYGVSMTATNVGLSAWFYRGNAHLLPRLSLDFAHIRPLLSLGLQFFAIQISVLVIFTTDKILITQFFGPQYVTQYDIVFKLFSAITLVHGLITTPLWSSYTDAYHRGDNEWIKGMLRKQLGLFLVVVLGVAVLVPLAKSIIGMWIGRDLQVSMPLILTMGAYVIVSTWNNIFGYVLGGINKIRLGSYYTVLTALLNIPFCYLFAVKLHTGVTGIMLGTLASIGISSLITPFQAFYFIYTKQPSKFLSNVLR